MKTIINLFSHGCERGMVELHDLFEKMFSRQAMKRILAEEFNLQPAESNVLIDGTLEWRATIDGKFALDLGNGVEMYFEASGEGCGVNEALKTLNIRVDVRDIQHVEFGQKTIRFEPKKALHTYRAF